MADLQKNQDVSYPAVAAANGRATVTHQAKRNVPQLVTQVSVEIVSTTATNPLCSLRKNGRLITPLVAQSDAAGGEPPLPIRPNDLMTVEWTGLNAGDQCGVVVIYDEVEWGT